MKHGSLKIWCLLVLLLFLKNWAYAQYVPDSGYEAAKRASGQSNPTCPTNYDLPGSWGFPTCECTSYTAYRLNLNDVRHNNALFTNDWTSNVHFGYAHHWNTAATDLGIREDQYPAVGSVAHWNLAAIPGTGHVAYVQHLFTSPNDGKLTHIGVMEYNWADCKTCGPDHKYRYRKIGVNRSKGSNGYPTSFLHFEEKGRDASTTNATCVSGLSSRPSGANVGTFCWKHNGSDATCGNGSAHYYYDYRTCTKHAVTSGTTPSKSTLCGETTSVSGTTGYTINIGSGFPTPIDPTVLGTDFAMCQSGSSGVGNSRAVSGRLPVLRNKFWRDSHSTLLN